MSDEEKIKLVVSDFDGIFTDRKLTVYSDGKTSKTIDYMDIMAIAVIIKEGINFAVISGEKSAAIDVIASKFPMIKTYQDVRNKFKILKELICEYNITSRNVLYIGDDINDLECLKYVLYPCTVADAHKTVKELPNIYITKNNGGCCAFREIADLIYEKFFQADI